MVALYVINFVVGILLLSRAIQLRQAPESRWLIILTLAVSWIAFCSLNVYAQSSLEAKTYFSLLRFLGFAVLGQSWFFFLISLLRPRSIALKPLFVILAFAPAVVTWTLILVPRLNIFMAHSYRLFEIDNSSVVQFNNGLWFPVHFLTANFFSLSAIIFAFFAYFQSAQQQRNRISLIITGAVVSLVIDFICVTFFPDYRWKMLSGGTFVLTLCAIYYANLKYQLLESAQIAKDQVFNHLPDPILVFDRQNRLIAYNTAAIKFFGKDSVQLYRSFVLQDDDIMKIQNLQEVCVDDPTRASKEYFLVVHESAVSSFGEELKLRYFRRISDQKEKQLSLLSDLATTSHILNLVSHDLSGMVQVQSMVSQSLQADGTNPSREKLNLLTESIYTSKNFMANALAGIKTQQQSAELKESFSPVDLVFMCNQVISSLTHFADLKGVRMSVTTPPTGAVITCDEFLIQSVLRNLVINAIQASSSGQLVSVLIHANLNKIEIVISDAGPGITKDLLVQMNDLSSDLKALSIKKGFGIGLNISKRIVRLHRGNIQWISDVGHGTEVKVVLPTQIPSC